MVVHLVVHPRRSAIPRLTGAFTMASALALAATSVSTGAEHEADGSVMWVNVGVDLAKGAGVFTGFADIPSGSVTLVSMDSDPPDVSGVWLYDPDEPGGDTFEVHEQGPDGPTLDDGTIIAFLEWEIENGTGEYADLSASGTTIHATNFGKDMAVGTYTGTMGVPAE